MIRDFAHARVLSSLTQWWRRARDTVHGYLFIAPFFLFYIVFRIYPIIQGFYISLHRWELVGTGIVYMGLENYRILAGDEYFWSSLWHTVYFVILSGPVLVALGLLLALLINRPYRAMGVFRTLFYLPSVFSVSVITTIWCKVYEPNYGMLANWFNSLGLTPLHWLQSVELAMPAVTLTTLWWTVGGNMVVFLAGLQDIPVELYEAARLDGANRWNLFRHVTVPGLRRTFAFVTIMQVIGSFQMFGQVYNMTRGGPVGVTRTLVMYIYEKAFRDWQLGLASALAYALFAIMFVFSSVQLRFFTSAESER